KMDLGALNRVVEFSFLNFSVIVFFACLLLMYGVSLATAPPDEASIGDLTMNWSKGPRRAGFAMDAAFTAVIGAFILGLWIHFA
ncbi:MAG: hypothetical protein JNK87_26600, partial [Bryobacterales bacterium]|nr:hypothetical protein [Bryobacterales bacterium]